MIGKNIIKEEPTAEKAQAKPIDVTSPKGEETSYFKLFLGAATAGAVIYFGGPIAAVAAREAYTHYYGLRYGIPAIYNPKYVFVFMPLREHVGAYAYTYGPTLVTTLGTVALKAADTIKWVSRYFKKVKKEEPVKVEIPVKTEEPPKVEAPVTVKIEKTEELVSPVPIIPVTSDSDIEKLMKEFEDLSLNDPTDTDDDEYAGIAWLFDNEIKKDPEVKLEVPTPIVSDDKTLFQHSNQFR